MTKNDDDFVVTADFDWGRDKEDVVIERQLAIAVYENSVKDIVIRQERDLGDDEETFIVLPRQHLERIVSKLQTYLEKPSSRQR